MKQKNLLKIAICFFLITNFSYGQVLNENFDYGMTGGDLTTASGGAWVQHSGSADPVTYIAAPTSLTMADYPSSGVGGHATYSGSSQDVNRGFTEISSGTVYASALVNLSAVGSGNYFIHFNATGGFRARVGAKDNGSGDILFGIGTSSSTLTYGTTPYNLNTTYLLVFSYEIATGVSKIHILSAVTASEPATPEATNTGSTGTAINSIAFRQSSNIPALAIDGVRVGTSWNEILPAASTPGITLGAVSNNTNEDGTTATFTVVLNVAPASSVVVDVTSGDTGEVTINSPTSLTFTNGNWNTAQTITLTGINDVITDGNQDVTITVAVNDGSSDDAYDGISETTTVTNEDDDLPNIIINEIYADADEDANGDGTANFEDDEFVELVNLDNVSHDLTGYTISDAASDRHTFGAISIPAGGSVVIFGGGTPTGISGISGTASTGSFVFNNGGDTVTLKNAGGSTVATYTYGTEGGDNQSIARSPDLTGAFVKHDEISPNPVNFSPGRYNTTGQPFSINTWTGATDTSWTTATNWSLGIVPGNGDDIQINKTNNQPTASGAVTVNSVTINSGATLIAQDNFIGTVTYKRALIAPNWYSISSPVSGENMTNMRANNNFKTNVGNEIAFAPYDNSQTDPLDRWSYFNTTSTDALIDGKGYTTQLDATGNISFSGTMITTSLSTLSLTDNSAGTGTAFNSMGNPYPSFLNLSTLLTANDSGGNDLLTESTIWVWNEGNSKYDTYNMGSSYFIAPTQSFFVKADGGSTSFTITEAMQSSQTSDTFQKSTNTKESINLLISDGKINRDANIFYINGATTSFDNGYDSSMFGGFGDTFAVYTQSVANSTGRNLAIQSLPNSDYENMVIPIGIIADANKEITFSAEALNLPADIKVFLEDRQTNTLTRLDETNSEYTITLNEKVAGIGRFYLHTKSSAVLNTETVNLENISMYKSDDSTLRIAGLTQGKTSVTIYNMLGKQVLDISFTSNGVQDIPLPKVSTGVYIVELTTENGSLNKKITLE